MCWMTVLSDFDTWWINWLNLEKYNLCSTDINIAKYITVALMKKYHEWALHKITPGYKHYRTAYILNNETL